jgi:hypothetical protein
MGSFPMAEESAGQIQQILAAQIELAKLQIDNWLLFFALLQGSGRLERSSAPAQRLRFARKPPRHPLIY